MTKQSLKPQPAILLQAAIQSTLAKLLASKEHASAEAINGGYCSGFVEDVYEELGGMDVAYDMGISELDIQNILMGGEEFAPFDKKLLTKHWPNIVPPADLTWDDMDRLSEDAGFWSGTHVWMVLDGRHYDAECPQGVDNVFDLPFFQRVVQSWVREVKVPHKAKGLAL